MFMALLGLWIHKNIDLFFACYVAFSTCEMGGYVCKT
jgi:hypothetical protein